MNSFKEELLKEEFDEELNDLMYQFLLGIDVDLLSEEKQYQYYEIMDMVAEDKSIDDTVSEVPTEADIAEAKLKKHIKKSDKAERKREYRKNKGKLKRAAKKLRKTSAFKKKKKKSKRMAKRGKTMTGKRQTTFT